MEFSALLPYDLHWLPVDIWVFDLLSSKWLCAQETSLLLCYSWASYRQQACWIPFHLPKREMLEKYGLR